MNESDVKLLSAIQSGDETAFKNLYNKYTRTVYDYLCYLERDRSSVADLYQDVWLRVAQSLGKGVKVNHFRAWLFAIIANCYRDVLRKRKKRANIVEKEHLRSKTAEEAIDHSWRHAGFRDDLEKALAALSPRQRQIFVLKQIEGFRYREIADMLGIAIGTCKATMYNAMQTLQEKLSDYAYEK